MLRALGLIEKTLKGYRYQGLKGLAKLTKSLEGVQEEKTASNGTATPLEKTQQPPIMAKPFKPRVLQSENCDSPSLCGKREKAEEGMELNQKLFKLGETEGAFKRFSVVVISHHGCETAPLANIVTQ